MWQLVFVFAVGICVSAIYFKSKGKFNRPAETPEHVTVADGSESLNIQYNEMISEVSSLIRESLEKAEVDREIEMARSVQSTILPKPSASYRNIDVAGQSYVAGSCGGDWWYHACSGDTVTVWLGDVTGHGIASALVASASRAVASTLRFSQSERSMSDYLRLMNDVIFDMTNGEIYLTLICLRMDLKTGLIEIGNASHPAPIRLDRDGQDAEKSFSLVEAPLNPPIGCKKGVDFQTAKIPLGASSALFLYSDGLLDMPEPEGLRWNLKGVCRFLGQAFLQTDDTTALIGKVDQFLPRAIQIGLPDDVTFVAVGAKTAESL